MDGLENGMNTADDQTGHLEKPNWGIIIKVQRNKG